MLQKGAILSEKGESQQSGMETAFNKCKGRLSHFFGRDEKRQFKARTVMSKGKEPRVYIPDPFK